MAIILAFSLHQAMLKDGLLNNLINNLPFELHLPGYNYCGPGTKLRQRLAQGDRGINPLDELCKHHDIAYSKSSDLKERHKADLVLLKMAKKRAIATDASFGEKVAADFVNKTMLAKVSSGAGFKKSFKKIVSHTKKHIKKLKPKCKKAALELAYAAAKELTSNTSLKLPRIIPIPKSGGVLPLIPIFAGLSAAGSLAGGVAGITKAINDYRAAKKRLNELQRHNKKIEDLSIGKGLCLKPYKDGLGIYTSLDCKQKN